MVKRAVSSPRRNAAAEPSVPPRASPEVPVWRSAFPKSAGRLRVWRSGAFRLSLSTADKVNNIAIINIREMFLRAKQRKEADLAERRFQRLRKSRTCTRSCRYAFGTFVLKAFKIANQQSSMFYVLWFDARIVDVSRTAAVNFIGHCTVHRWWENS